MESLFETGPSVPLVILRLGLALVFFAHSSQQLGWFGGNGAKKVIGSWKEKYGIPLPIGALGIFTEVAGSLALLAGFLSRAFALGLAVFMAVAMWPTAAARATASSSA